jgi:pteridine reductase
MLGKVALVTGAARRLGAQTARALHSQGCNVAIHCHQSIDDAQRLVSDLNQVRANSAIVIQTQLGLKAQADDAIDQAVNAWGRLDILVNNASSFFPTPIGDITDEQVSDLLASNFIAPLFLIQAASVYLQRDNGSVVNIIDVHASKPYKDHTVYCSAKSALQMLTRSMALELAPSVRVNGVAPGAILWPEGGESFSQAQIDSMTDKIPLKRKGEDADIANTVVFLASEEARYITGQIIAVDGGKLLT